jgi:hypothetical protein
MQFVGLATYVMERTYFAVFPSRNFSLSLFYGSLHPPISLHFLAGCMCAVSATHSEQLQQQITFYSFCTRVNRAWIHTQLSR